jgi:hypothetical protein
VKVVCENEPDDENVDVEEQHGNQDIGVVSSHVGGKWYKDNRNKQEYVNPEQTGIDCADEMELAVMIQPETRKNQKSDNKNKDFRNKIENLAGKYVLSLGYIWFWGINPKDENSHCDGKDAIDHSFQSVF